MSIPPSGFLPYGQPQELNSIDTPAALIDLHVLEANIDAVARMAQAHDVELRPHAKTHKSAWIAAKQAERGAAGVTVAKVSEAEALVTGGVKDVFVAYPIVTGPKIDRLLRLAGRARVTTLVEDLEGVDRLARAAEAHGDVLGVWVDVDTGLHRIGSGFDELERVLERVRRYPTLKLQGLSTHEGHVYKVAAPSVRAQRVRLWIGELVAAARGLGVTRVSTGATPTISEVLAIDGVTDARPGNYVFHDAMQVGLGAASTEACAMSVLTTCVSSRADRAFVDAGSKALSSDTGAHGSTLVTGYGIFKGRPDLSLTGLSEEHGWLTTADGGDGVAVGDRLELIPNHSCSTIANFEWAEVVAHGSVIGRAHITARGCLT